MRCSYGRLLLLRKRCSASGLSSRHRIRRFSDPIEAVSNGIAAAAQTTIKLTVVNTSEI
jgi:hypothetical protein